MCARQQNGGGVERGDGGGRERGADRDRETEICCRELTDNPGAWRVPAQ